MGSPVTCLPLSCPSSPPYRAPGSSPSPFSAGGNHLPVQGRLHPFLFLSGKTPSCNRVMPVKSPMQEQAESWRGKAGKSPRLRLPGGISAPLDPQQDVLTHTLYLPGTNLLKVRGRSAAARQADKSPGTALQHPAGELCPCTTFSPRCLGVPKTCYAPCSPLHRSKPLSQHHGNAIKEVVGAGKAGRIFC